MLFTSSFCQFSPQQMHIFYLKKANGTVYSFLAVHIILYVFLEKSLCLIGLNLTRVPKNGPHCWAHLVLFCYIRTCSTFQNITIICPKKRKKSFRYLQKWIDWKRKYQQQMGGLCIERTETEATYLYLWKMFSSLLSEHLGYANEECDVILGGNLPSMTHVFIGL